MQILDGMSKDEVNPMSALDVSEDQKHLKGILLVEHEDLVR